MNALDAKIPPPAVAAAIALSMWGLARYAPAFEIAGALRLGAAAALLLLGLGFSAAGLLAFKRARTTVNPTAPEKATTLVDFGVYRITRNPMYVGLSCVLVAWAVFLSCAWALLGPLALVLYIGRFQIRPEERALATLFGSDYSAYRQKVRRWL